MAKLLICGDVHWSKYSSILRSRGKDFSTRLENLIKSVQWVEHLGVANGVDGMVYLGDFFDTADLSAEEITALESVSWNSKTHYYLVGNHEMGTNDLKTSSTEIFNMKLGMLVVNVPMTFHFNDNEFCFLPYVLEENREELSHYFNSDYENKRVIFSHNDIAGIQMGMFVSKEGFEIEDIENNCDLFLNGHLHNGTRVTDKIYNVGNLTGQNFSEDILIYKHKVCILDTETLEMTWVENPYSIGFAKFNSLDSFKVARFELIPELTCLVVKVKEEEVAEARELLKGYLASKLIVAPQEKKENVEHEEQNLGMNHIESFIEFVRETFEPSEILEEELEKVVK